MILTKGVLGPGGPEVELNVLMVTREDVIQGFNVMLAAGKELTIEGVSFQRGCQWFAGIAGLSA